MTTFLFKAKKAETKAMCCLQAHASLLCSTHPDAWATQQQLAQVEIDEGRDVTDAHRGEGREWEGTKGAEHSSLGEHRNLRANIQEQRKGEKRNK
jgi:hypothetical protein